MGARLALLTLLAWYGGYLLLAFPPQAADLVAGAAVAGLGAVATQAALVAAGRRFAWPPGLAAELVRLPWQVLRGYVRVVSAGLRPGQVRGDRRREAVPGAADDGPSGAGRRAVTGWARSLSPDTLVLGFAGDAVELHVLPAPGRRAAQR